MPDDPASPDPARAALLERMARIAGKTGGAGRDAAFFESVYGQAGGDPSGVPWADLAPKPQLVAWLAGNPGEGRRAVDIGCGLGDAAAAMAAAGWTVTAFDFVPEAVDWARRRFPDSGIDWHVADVTALPDDWHGRFDLVHECFTIQSLPPERHAAVTAALAALVKPGGTLLIYTVLRPAGAAVTGPPWPLEPAEVDAFAALGFTRTASQRFETARHGRAVPQGFDIWQREG